MRCLILFFIIFMLDACCGQVNIPETLPAALQGSLWKMTISHNGQGMFEGLLAIGLDRKSGMDMLHCSIIDSTGITLMKLAGQGERLDVEMALPPFAEKGVSGYIISELRLFLACSGWKDEYAGHGICQAREYQCEENDMDSGFTERCISAYAGPFVQWRFRGIFGPAPQDAGHHGMIQAVIMRPWSGMTMRLYRLQ